MSGPNPISLTDAPGIRRPDPLVLFNRRSQRLLALSQECEPKAYLNFLSVLASAQHRAALRYKKTGCATWSSAAQTMIEYLRNDGVSESFHRLIADLDKDKWDGLNVVADSLQRGEWRGVDPSVGVFVGAALQVHWSVIATNIDPVGRKNGEISADCPVCSSAPLAAVIGSGAEPAARFLVCTLCATEWYWPRIRCVACQSDKVTYYRRQIDTNGLDLDKGIRVEVCAACSAYLKIFDLRESPYSDPACDDIASLSLDIVLGEAGQNRIQPNLLLLPG